MANRNPSPGTRFQKGVSGNPKGRPKLPDIREALMKVLSDEKDGTTALEATLMALRARAVKGDIRAAEVLLDRAFGKPKQAIDHTLDVRRLSEMTDEELEAQAKALGMG